MDDLNIAKNDADTDADASNRRTLADWLAGLLAGWLASYHLWVYRKKCTYAYKHYRTETIVG